MSFKKDRLKLFIPARSEILDHADGQVEVNKTWYKCPEHDFNKKISLKYDVWSIGWLLYNLCALEDSRIILDQVDDFNTWDRPIIPRHYSRHIDKIFRKMTQPDPEERPSVEELLEDEIFTTDYLAYQRNKFS
jgi:serine/threonine protein kinase